jgi:mRNA-degrading endonuclease toxin of MazEF toxin-antitoxin module
MLNRGDILKIKFPFSDFTRGKIRPALVISDEEMHKTTGDIMLIQITSKERNDKYSIPILETDTLKPLPLRSYIRPHRIFVAEHTMISGKITRMKSAKYKAVVEAIIAIIS